MQVAEFLSTEPPTAKEADDWGLTQEEACGGYNEIWPENWETVRLFCAMSTQWRVGPGGRTGLDYLALQPVMRLLGIQRSQWTGMFDDIRTMESAALGAMAAARQ